MKSAEKDNTMEKLFESRSGLVPLGVEGAAFTEIFNNNLAPMLLVDPEDNQKIIKVNESACRFYGYKRKDFLQLTMGDINILSFEERKRLMKEAISRPHSNFNIIHKTSSELLKDVEVTASPVTVNNKKVMFIIVHDITVQKRVELQLRESEERLTLALEGTDLGMWDWHIQTGEVHYDKKWAEIIGYTLDELYPLTIDTWRGNTHPEDLEFIDIELNRYFTKQSPVYEHESRMKHKNGKWIWVLDRGKVFEWDSNGKPLRMAGTHLDITEQKSVQKKLEESESKFRSYFDSSPLVLWEEDHSKVAEYLNTLPVSNEEELAVYLDHHPEEIRKCLGLLTIINMNKASLDLYEADSKEQIINNLQNIFTPSTLAAYRDELVKVYCKSSSMVYSFTDKTLKGNLIDVKLEMTLQSDYKYLATITDMTEQKNKESELKKLLDQTKADTETKGILLREINHRVKNNLSSLIGILYAEKRKSKNTLENKQLELLDNLINRVKGISIAHDLLSRSGWRPISMELLSEKIINSLKHLIPSDRSIQTEINKSSVTLDADQSQSMAVIINELFVNSLEHASAAGGKLKINIKILENKGSVYYKYRDNGPGFSEEVLTSKLYNVGLYLIKNIVEQGLRGKIALKNKNGALVEIKFPGGEKIAEIQEYKK